MESIKCTPKKTTLSVSTTITHNRSPTPFPFHALNSNKSIIIKNNTSNNRYLRFNNHISFKRTARNLFPKNNELTNITQKIDKLEIN